MTVKRQLLGAFKDCRKAKGKSKDPFGCRQLVCIRGRFRESFQSSIVRARRSNHLSEIKQNPVSGRFERGLLFSGAVEIRNSYAVS